MSALAALLAPTLSTAAADAVASSGEEGADIGAALIAWTGRAISIAGFILCVPSLLCGWGLLRHHSWARWLGILLAAIAVVQIPVGTILGGYLLWVLLSTRSEPWFDGPDTDGRR